MKCTPSLTVSVIIVAVVVVVVVLWKFSVSEPKQPCEKVLPRSVVCGAGMVVNGCVGSSALTEVETELALGCLVWMSLCPLSTWPLLSASPHSCYCEETPTRGKFHLFLTKGNFQWRPLATRGPHPSSLQPQHTLGHVLSIS